MSEQRHLPNHDHANTRELLEHQVIQEDGRDTNQQHAPLELAIPCDVCVHHFQRLMCSAVQFRLY